MIEPPKVNDPNPYLSFLGESWNLVGRPDRIVIEQHMYFMQSVEYTVILVYDSGLELSKIAEDSSTKAYLRAFIASLGSFDYSETPVLDLKRSNTDASFIVYERLP